jgi:hypothetical protein
VDGEIEPEICGYRGLSLASGSAGIPSPDIRKRIVERSAWVCTEYAAARGN